jgi:hypothetical protein
MPSTSTPLFSLQYIITVTYNYPDPTPVAYRNHSVTHELNQLSNQFRDQHVKEEGTVTSGHISAR